MSEIWFFDDDDYNIIYIIVIICIVTISTGLMLMCKYRYDWNNEWGAKILDLHITV